MIKNIRLVEEFNMIIKSYKDSLTFHNYKNVDKIVKIFEFWITELSIALLYNKAIPENCLNYCQYFSTLDGIDLSEKTFSPVGLKSKFKYFVWYILSFIPLGKGILPGGVIYKFDYIIANLTSYKLNSVNVKINQKLKDYFFNNIDNQLLLEETRSLRFVIPDVFFQIKKKGLNLPKVYTGSATCFFSRNFLSLLFVDFEIKLVGLQHGGFYGELKNNRWEVFEKKISDIFYHWGFGKNNLKQNRFKNVFNIPQNTKHLLLPAVLKPNNFIKSYFPDYTLMYKQMQSNQEFLCKKLTPFIPVTYLMHPRSRVPNEFTRSNKFLYNISHNELSKSIFLFTLPGSTTFYNCIYNNIPFVLYYNRSWNIYLSNNYLKFIDYLKKLNLFYYWDQEKQFFDFLKNISVSNSFTPDLFNNLRRYLVS